MSEVNYPFATGGGFTRGETIWANGYIAEPGTGDSTSATAIRNSIERLSELVYYVGSGGVGGSVYVSATAQPAGGYTFTGNPGIFKGTGLRLHGAPLDFASSATITGTYTNSATAINSGTHSNTAAHTHTADILQSGSGGRIIHRVSNLDNTDATLAVAGTHDTYTLYDPSNASTQITLDAVASFPVSPATAAFRIRILIYNMDAGKTLDIVRTADASNIVAIAPVGASKFYGVELEYAGGRWTLSHISADEAYAINVAG